MWRDPHGRRIGDDAPLYVIAEIGLNHGGSPARALAMVDAAAAAGASAVKLQSLTAAELVAPSCPPPAHVSTPSLRAFFAQFELSADAHAAVVARARALGLGVLTTPFSERLIPTLAAIGFDAWKVASGDLTNDRLLFALACTGTPLVLSTGMATLPEVVHAVRLVRDAGGTVAAVLHCVSAYPAPPAAQNLRAIATLAEAVECPVGLSDHSADGLVSAVAAVALGAAVYERHFVLDGDTAAIDYAVSSTPAALRQIVDACADTARRLGSGRKVCHPAEAVNRPASRRGVYARTALPAGHVITTNDLVALRPETEIPASELPALLGRALDTPVAAGAPLTWRHLQRRAA
ncbi:MAG: N-acetylneuraminate synthase family protein [Vicinamibacterales bacterium]